MKLWYFYRALSVAKDVRVEYTSLSCSFAILFLNLQDYSSNIKKSAEESGHNECGAKYSKIRFSFP